MKTITLYHGSNFIIKKPKYSLGKKSNDYGQGFYCTIDFKLAGEWACKNNNSGYINKYNLDLSSLKVLNLLDEGYSVLNWIALLLKNRRFNIKNEIARDAREYIIDNFSIDVTQYDIIIGYRADDSYFSYAESFINNGLPVRLLNQALRLGNLGIQYALISEKAFNKIGFVEAIYADKNEYYPSFISKDIKAREVFNKGLKNSKAYKTDIYVMDILREEIKNDDARIQRIVSK